MTDYLNQLLSLLDKVQGLSANALICFSCIVVGYALRFIKPFPNGGIPLAIILWGAIFRMMIADPKINTVPFRIWVAQNLMIGLIIGCIAWGIHYWGLHYLEQWLNNKFGTPKKDETSTIESGESTKP